jgi:hypothetical protein
MYDVDEVSLTRFNIVLCELYNRKIHGKPSNSNIEYYYLTIDRYKKLDIDTINDTAEYLNTEYNYVYNQTHYIFKNYINIITQQNYIKPEIAECIYLPTGECVSIIKTFWIRWIQRVWKKIYKERQNVFNRRLSIQSLKYRELNGKWPQNCLVFPSIRGMLT